MTLGRHSLDLLAFAVVLLGPVPFCAALCEEPQRRRAATHALLGLLVAWCTLQLAVGLVLGSLGWLRLASVLAAEGLLLVVGAALVIRRRPSASAFVAARRLTLAEWLVVGATATLGASLLLQLAIQPITDHDSLGYHLPTMARWYQAGTLVPPVRRDQVGHYPYGWELLSTLFLLPFREDFLVAAPNLLAWTILGLGVLRVGVQAGASRLHALAGAFCVLAIPLVRRQVTTMHVDLALAAFFTAGVSFALAYGRSRSRVDLALFVAALGLVAGVKTSGLVYAAMLVAAFVLARERGAAPDSRWLPLVLIPPALLAGTFWYIRNLLEVGNPIGLVRLAAFGHTLFPGPIEPAALARTTLASLFDVRRAEDWRVVATVAVGSLGLPFVLLVVAALALLCRPRRLGRRSLVVLLLLAGCAWAYVVTPYSAVIAPTRTTVTPWMANNLRFALPFLPLLGATASLGATRVAGAAVVVLAVVAVLAGTTRPVMATGAGLVLLVGAAAAMRRRPAVAAAIATSLAAVVLRGSLQLRAHRDAERQRVYAPVTHVVAHELRGSGAVAHITMARSYLLYGTNLANPVVFARATSDDRDAWVAALRARHVVLVAAGPLNPRRRRGPEFAWLADPAGPFERIAGEDLARETVLYRLADPATTDGR